MSIDQHKNNAKSTLRGYTANPILIICPLNLWTLGGTLHD